MGAESLETLSNKITTSIELVLVHWFSLYFEIQLFQQPEQSVDRMSTLPTLCGGSYILYYNVYGLYYIYIYILGFLIELRSESCFFIQSIEG
jgi:hypothetical protein